MSLLCRLVGVDVSFGTVKVGAGFVFGALCWSRLCVLWKILAQSLVFVGWRVASSLFMLFGFQGSLTPTGKFLSGRLLRSQESSRS